MSDEHLMTGFPPPDSAQVTLANWRTAPFNRWGFQHVREIIPSADIANACHDVWTLPSVMADFSEFSFEYQGKRFGFDTFLAASATDGIHVLHRGSCIAEIYRHGMTKRTPHILMSVSKSLLGIIAGILVAKGDLDPDQLLADPPDEVPDDPQVDVGLQQRQPDLSQRLVDVGFAQPAAAAEAAEDGIETVGEALEHAAHQRRRHPSDRCLRPIG